MTLFTLTSLDRKKHTDGHVLVTVICIALLFPAASQNESDSRWKACKLIQSDHLSNHLLGSHGQCLDLFWLN